MSDIRSSFVTQPSKVVNFVDHNLNRMTAVLDDVAGRIASVESNGDLPAHFASSAIKQVQSLNDRIQSVDGETIVAHSKDAIERHPAATTIIAAVIGAAVAQIAILTVRRERQEQPQPNQPN
jgi:hypothetical protein